MSAAEAWGLIPTLPLTHYPLQKKNSIFLRVSICSRFVQGFSKGLNDQKDLSRCATYGSGFPASLCGPEVPKQNSRSTLAPFILREKPLHSSQALGVCILCPCQPCTPWLIWKGPFHAQSVGYFRYTSQQLQLLFQSMEPPCHYQLRSRRDRPLKYLFWQEIGVICN